MQVLSRDRRVPEPLPPPARLVRRGLLGPVAMRALDLEHDPEVPATAVPAAAELAAVTRLRCTVLIPAHDEEAVLGIDAGLPRRTDTSTGPGAGDRRQLHRRDRRGGPQPRRRGGRDRRQHREEGRRPQPAARPAATDGASSTTWSSSWTPTRPSTRTSSRSPSDCSKSDPDLIAVGGLFYGEDGGGLIGQFQRNEYTRYQRIVARKLNRVFVLTGTASVIRSYALRAVAEPAGC